MKCLKPTDITLGDGDQHDVEVVRADRLREILQDHSKECKVIWCDVCGFISHAFGVLLK